MNKIYAQIDYIEKIILSDRNAQRKLDIIESAIGVLNKRISEIPTIGYFVYHTDIYDGKEIMKIVGIRENEVELEGDYSGGTHNVTQKSWMPITGIIFTHISK